jgi:hypothetical protein
MLGGFWPISDSFAKVTSLVRVFKHPKKNQKMTTPENKAKSDFTNKKNGNTNHARNFRGNGGLLEISDWRKICPIGSKI